MVAIDRKELEGALAGLAKQRQEFLDKANMALGAINIVQQQIASLDAREQDTSANSETTR